MSFKWASNKLLNKHLMNSSSNKRINEYLNEPKLERANKQAQVQ